jgi:hypothetical protein
MRFVKFLWVIPNEILNSPFFKTSLFTLSMRGIKWLAYLIFHIGITDGLKQ